MARIGRNAPCPCGSGKKYKKCCMDKPSLALLKPESILGTFWFYHDVDAMSTEH